MMTKFKKPNLLPSHLHLLIALQLLGLFLIPPSAAYYASGNAITSPNPTATQQLTAQVDLSTPDQYYVILTETSTYSKATFFFPTSAHVIPPILGVYKLTRSSSTTVSTNIPPQALSTSYSASFIYIRSSNSQWSIVGFTTSYAPDWPVSAPSAISANFPSQQTNDDDPMGSSLPGDISNYRTIISQAILTTQASTDISCYINVDLTGVLRGFYLNGRQIMMDSSLTQQGTVTIQSTQKITLQLSKYYLVTIIGAYLDVTYISLETCTRSTSSAVFSVTPVITALTSAPIDKNDVYYTMPAASAITCSANCSYCTADSYPSSKTSYCLICASGFYLSSGACVSICNSAAQLYPNRKGICEATLRRAGFAMDTTNCTANSAVFNVYLDIWSNTQTLAIFSASQAYFGNHQALWYDSPYTLPENKLVTFTLNQGVLSTMQAYLNYLLSSTASTTSVLFYEFATSYSDFIMVVGYPRQPTTTATKIQASSISYSGINSAIMLNSGLYYRIQAIVNCNGCTISIIANGAVQGTLNGRTNFLSATFGGDTWNLPVSRVFSGLVQFTFTVTKSTLVQLNMTSTSWSPIKIVSLIHYESCTLPTGTQCSITNCNNCNKTLCLSCSSGYLLTTAQTACVSSCPAGTLSLPTEGKCVTTCPSFTIKVGSNCYPICNSGRYFLPSNGCDNYCSQECNQCFGPNANQCISCDPSKNLTGTQCLCPPGATENSTTLECECPDGLTLTTPGCIHCSPVCGTCNGPTDNNCTSCDRPRSMFNTTCLCPPETVEASGTRQCLCPPRQFPDYTGCYDCYSTCYNCTGSNYDSCTSCELPRVLNGTECRCPSGFIEDLTTRTCDCPDHYYYNSTNQTCSNCHYSCLKCNTSSQTACTTCAAPRSLSGGLCLCPSGSTDNSTTLTCQCPSNQFMNSSGCFDCHITCTSCSGPSQTQCTACSTPRSLTSSGTCSCSSDAIDVTSTGACTCPSYKYSTTSGCQACDVSCLQCSGSNSSNCTACASPLSLSNGYCVCPPGSTQDPSTGQCSCPAGTYLTDSGCFTCPSRCLTCTGPNTNQCTSCSQDKLLVNNECKCWLGVYIPSTNTCGCNSNQFPSFELCTNCHSSCRTCSDASANGCTSCSYSYILQFDNSCACFYLASESNQRCNCPAGYYLNTDSRCIACDPTCRYCTGPASNQCTQCVARRSLNTSFCSCTNFFVENTTSGECLCPSEYFQYGDTCLQCPLTKTYVNDTCICIPGTYESGGVCHSCHKECLTCKGPEQNDCTSCAPGVTFYASEDRCILEDHTQIFPIICASFSGATLLLPLLLYFFSLCMDYPFTNQRRREKVTPAPAPAAVESDMKLDSEAKVEKTPEGTTVKTGFRSVLSLKSLKSFANLDIKSTTYDIDRPFAIQLAIKPQKFSNELRRHSPFYSIFMVPNSHYSRQLRAVLFGFFLNWKLYTTVSVFYGLDRLQLRGELYTIQSFGIVLALELVITCGSSIVIGMTIKLLLARAFRTRSAVIPYLRLLHVLVIGYVLIIILAALTLDIYLLDRQMIRAKNFQVFYSFLISIVAEYIFIEAILARVMSHAGSDIYRFLKKMRFANVFNVPIMAEEKVAADAEKTMKKITNNIYEQEIKRRRKNFAETLGEQAGYNLKRFSKAGDASPNPETPSESVFKSVLPTDANLITQQTKNLTVTDSEPSIALDADNTPDETFKDDTLVLEKDPPSPSIFKRSEPSFRITYEPDSSPWGSAVDSPPQRGHHMKSKTPVFEFAEPVFEQPRKSFNRKHISLSIAPISKIDPALTSPNTDTSGREHLMQDADFSPLASPHTKRRSNTAVFEILKQNELKRRIIIRSNSQSRDEGSDSEESRPKSGMSMKSMFSPKRKLSTFYGKKGNE